MRQKLNKNLVSPHDYRKVRPASNQPLPLDFPAHSSRLNFLGRTQLGTFKDLWGIARTLGTVLCHSTNCSKGQYVAPTKPLHVLPRVNSFYLVLTCSAKSYSVLHGTPSVMHLIITFPFYVQRTCPCQAESVLAELTFALCVCSM